MAWASRSGRARTSAKNPRAFGVCDRCGIWYNFNTLKWQYDWRGTSLQNLRFLVCDRCYDLPQEQLRSIVVPPDPTPIMNARVEAFQADETDYLTVGQGSVDPITGIPIPATTVLDMQDGSALNTQPVGRPTGYVQNAQMPLVENQQWAVQLPLLSVSSIGTTVITVTCSKPHGLATNAQIGVQGLSNSLATGAYSITVTTATAFTYEVASPIPAGSLLTPTTSMVTMNMGLPYNYVQIPQPGP
jgi:hypothetical protein